MVMPEPAPAPSAEAVEREALRAHFRLFIVVVVCAMSFGVLGCTGLAINAPSLERASIYCFIPIPVTAYVLARRHARAILTEPDLRGRFSSMGSIFGFVFVLAFAITVPAWESVVWALAAAAGGRAWYLVREDKRGKKGRARD